MKEQIDTVKIEGHTVDFETLRNNLDGKVWAEQFNQALSNRNLPKIDENWLTSWFSSSIMCGYDRAMKDVSNQKCNTLKAVLKSLRKEYS